jgi:methylase of polypeptide subunit release factors
MMEVGLDMGTGVQAILEATGYQAIEILNDYAGCERIVTAIYP